MNIPPQKTEPLRQLQRLSQPASQAHLLSDAELLELYVARGDRQAAETLVERYAAMVATVCRLTVNDSASAEDAFQVTFLVLLKSARKVRKRESIAAWLHGVAYRTACRIRSRQRRQVSAEMSTQLATQTEPTSPPSDPIHELARRMELEVLDRELQRLPEALRAPLIEHYLLGHSAPQIAERMELSVSAVEGRLRRGRRTLRRTLAQRGIGLSFSLAGAHWFQQHVHAAEASLWAARFVRAHVPVGGEGVEGMGSESDSASGHEPRPTAQSTEISSLVAEETNMFLQLAYAKTLVPIAVLAVGAIWASLYNGLHLGTDDGTGTSAFGVNAIDDDTPQATTLQALPPPNEDHIVAQMGMGGMGGMGAGQTVQPRTPAVDQEPVTWEKPAEADVPAWLAGGHASTEAIESNRAALAKQAEVDFSGSPLRAAIDQLQSESGVPIVVNLRELEPVSIDPDTPIYLSAKGSLREILRRIGEPLELTYIITESAIELTTRDHANESPSLRFYDLSYVLPNSANASAVVQALQNSVDPNSWTSAGGTSVITLVGSMMIVSAPDSTQQHVEVMLINLSKMNPRNAERETNLQVPFMPTEGMGGMGGGMF